MRVDQQEAFEIIVSILAISLALSFAVGGLDIDPPRFFFLMSAFTITVGSGFVLHELAHRYYAIKFGAKARYKAWPFGLGLALFLAIVPQIFGWPTFLFIAPGAVYIYAIRPISRREAGIISLAGPVTNFILAFIFLLFALIFGGNVIAEMVAVLGARANMLLAMFNLLPIFPLDGSKVFHWDWKIWLASFALAFFGLSLLGGF